MLVIDPKSVNELIDKGISLDNLGEHQEAYKIFAKAVRIDPKNLKALTNKGISLFNFRKYQNAYKIFVKAVRIDPKNLEALNNMGVALSGLGEHREAIKVFNEVLTIDPSHVIARKNKKEALVKHDANILRNKRIMNSLASQEKTYKEKKAASPSSSIVASQNIQLIKKQYENKEIFEDHKTYINSTFWIEKRKEINSIYENNGLAIECIKCKASNRLQLHHNYYVKYLGCENISDLDYLCFKCHDDWHKIQKGLGSQNKLFKEYYAFITAGQSAINRVSINNTFRKKIEINNIDIAYYFSDSEVIKYQKLENIAGWLGILSLPLMIVGIGVITAIVSFNIFRKNKKPALYDLFQAKKNTLEIKKRFLSSVMN